MDYLQIAVLVLVVIAVWAVVEIALTMRSARRDISKLTASATEAISTVTEVVEQAQPVVAKLDGIADELEPASKRLVPLIEEAEAAAGSVDDAFKSLNGVLEDVSTVSGTASSVTDAVNRAAESAVSGVVSVVSRLKGGPSHEAARLEGAPRAQDQERADEAPAPQREESAPTRYVEYTTVSAGSADEARVTEEL